MTPTTLVGDMRSASAIAQHWIDGRWRDSAEHKDSVNPATGEVIGRYALAGEDGARAATAAARRAFRETNWKSGRVLRSRVLHEMADRFEAHRADLIALVSTETGKIVPDATFEVSQAASGLRYYAALGSRCRCSTPTTEAVAMANNSDYGLAASIWTRDVDRPLRIARELQVGTVWVNDWVMMRDEFEEGGYKQSGRGRLRGLAALDGFLEYKHIVLNPGVVAPGRVTRLTDPAEARTVASSARLRRHPPNPCQEARSGSGAARTQMPAALRILIVGGGIAGLGLCRALQHGGGRVHGPRGCAGAGTHAAHAWFAGRVPVGVQRAAARSHPLGATANAPEGSCENAARSHP